MDETKETKFSTPNSTLMQELGKYLDEVGGTEHGL